MIADVRPDLPLATLPRRLHGNACFVGVDCTRLFHVFAHERDERLEQLCSRLQPRAHRAPRDAHAGTLEDMFETIERQVVAELAGDHISKQARTSQPLVDRLRRLRGLLDLQLDRRGFAAFAGVGVADVPQHLERRGQVFELFPDFLADPMSHLAAAGARLLGVGQVVLDVEARQMVGQLLTTVPLTSCSPDSSWVLTSSSGIAST